jgi:hypothetical protein
MWSSSPLRRYVDMVNQRQIIAMLRGEEPAYPKNDTALYTTMRDFDTMYGIYGEFQKSMERYWCLRWLLQEKYKLVNRPSNNATVESSNVSTPLPGPLDETTSHSTKLQNTAAKSLVIPQEGEGDKGSLRELLVDAIVLRENLVKVADIPLIFRAPSLPELPANTRVQLAIGEIDLLDLEVQTRFVAKLEGAAC